MSRWVLVFLLCTGSVLAQETPSMKDAYSLLAFRSTVWNDTYGSLRNWYMSFAGHACEWRGVECNAVTHRVTGLQLSGLSLYGAISPSLGELSELAKLDLSKNTFMGVIPPQLVKCKELTELNLGFNLLTADIPSELGRLPKLEVLLLNNNNLYGFLPTSLSNLTLLTRLSVAANMLSGYPFQIVASLKSLEYINFMENRFQGAILNQTLVDWPNLRTLLAGSNKFDHELPATLSNLTQLETLDVSQNSIQGSIPPEVAKCGNLHVLNLSFNSLSGAIPDALGEMSALTTLDLHANSFNSGIPTGQAGYNSLVNLHLSRNRFLAIPSDLATLPNVLYVDISRNELEGGIPVTLGTMTNLLSLNFSHNKLSSNIPPQLGGCVSLRVLDLSHNVLEEMIPYTIIKMRSLECLNLSTNHLKGKLPEEFGHLTKLSELDISGNGFTGTIPKVLGDLPKLRFLDVSNNKLSGVVPGNLMRGLFPASAFTGNADLCGAILNKSCTLYLGRSVAPGGMMASAATLVLSLIVLMVATWWFCCRDDLEEQLISPIPGAGVLQRFTAEALQRATMNFSSENFIGAANLCSVYKGEIADGNVAVKVLCPEYYVCDRRSFAVEAKMLVKVLHPNIVKVVGCCNSGNLVALVLELMPNGSLENYLYGSEVCELSWIQRLDIVLGVAEGLAYIHHEWESILSCDVKASSILLDKDLKAHISNFRLAGTSATNLNESAGHLPPEYMFSTLRTTQGDAYSYGILVLEVLTRISPHGDILWQGGLARWVQQSYPDTLSEILDPQLMELTLQRQSIMLCTEVALLCTQEVPQQRPTMSDVVHMLQRIRRSKELTHENSNLASQSRKRRKSVKKHSIAPGAETTSKEAGKFMLPTTDLQQPGQFMHSAVDGTSHHLGDYISPSKAHFGSQDVNEEYGHQGIEYSDAGQIGWDPQHHPYEEDFVQSPEVANSGWDGDTHTYEAEHVESYQAGTHPLDAFQDGAFADTGADISSYYDPDNVQQ